jgi:hypothetical protein
VDGAEPVQLRVLPVLSLAFLLLACSSARRKEEVFGEYRAEDRRFEVTLSLKRDMNYEQVVVFPDGTKKVFAGEWRFYEGNGRIYLPSVYDLSDGTIDSESLPTERFLGRLSIIVDENEGFYYRKVKSY